MSDGFVPGALPVDERATARCILQRVHERNGLSAPVPAGPLVDHNLLDTVRDPLLVLDGHLVVVAASRSFYHAFGVRPEETLGSSIYSLGNGQWDIPALRALLEEMLPGETTFDDFAVDHDFPTLGPR